jgi:hypothetical protein
LELTLLVFGSLVPVVLSLGHHHWKEGETRVLWG